MRILSVTTFQLGDDAASWRVLNIARLLQSRGHEVHLLQYVWKGNYGRRKDYSFGLGGVSSSVALVTKATIHIKHLSNLSKDRYDLVYGNTHTAAFCSVLGRLKKVPLIFDMHGGLVEEFMLNNQPDLGWMHPAKLFQYCLYKIIDSIDFRMSNKIICVSNKMISYLHTEKGVPLGKMVYVTNGVDLDVFRPSNDSRAQLLRASLGIKAELVFGYAGGFDKWQGVANLIQAADMVKDKRIAFVVIGGEGEIRKGNVIVLPRVSRSQIPDYYSMCDVLVLPRPSHPATEIAAPTKFAEYAAMGKPVLSTNVGDAAYLITRYNCGVVVKNNEPDSLAEGILQFTSMDNPQLELMGKSSRKLAENEFDWDKVAKNLFQAVTNSVN